MILAYKYTTTCQYRLKAVHSDEKQFLSFNT